MGVKLYNCLPNGLKTLNSVKIFKNEVKWTRLENSFYTVREFCSWKESQCWFYFSCMSGLVCCFVPVVVSVCLSCRIHVCIFVCVN
jgi:hypothetical protein